jgi:hypothetical protein
VKTSPVSGGLHSGNIRQLNKTVRRYSGAETPPFGMTGLEIREFPATDSVDKKIVGLLIQRFGSAAKASAELFQLTDIHECTSPRLTNQGNRPQSRYGAIMAASAATPNEPG